MTAKSLKQARESGELEQFAKDRDADAPGDELRTLLAELERLLKEK